MGNGQPNFTELILNIIRSKFVSELVTMKKILVFVAILGIVAAKPGKLTEDVENIKPTRTHITRDPEFLYGDFLSPFDLISPFTEIMNQLQERFRLALAASKGLTDGKGVSNSTTSTKVINGHKYIVNETEISGGDKDAGAIFKVRIIDVKPAEGEFPELHYVTTSSTTPKDVEKIEQSEENEVRSAEKKMERLETMDEEWSEPGELTNDININEIDEIDEGQRYQPDAEFVETGQSLADDLRVNEIAAVQGWTPNPDTEAVDIEIFDPVNQIKNSKYQYSTFNDR